MELDFKAVEDAEVRLEARSEQRRAATERRDRRHRLIPWLLCPVVLPVLGAAAVVGVVQSAGGDLRSWPGSQAAAVLGACCLVPAAVSAWVGRWHGRVEAVMWAVVTLGLEAGLVFGVGFVALGMGP